MVVVVVVVVVQVVVAAVGCDVISKHCFMTGGWERKERKLLAHFPPSGSFNALYPLESYNP